MLCAGGESEMGSLLAFMESAPFTQSNLKIDILKVTIRLQRQPHEHCGDTLAVDYVTPQRPSL